MQSTAAAANSQWVFQTPVDVNYPSTVYIYISCMVGHRGKCRASVHLRQATQHKQQSHTLRTTMA